MERAEVYGFGWGLRFERRYVACCLRFGPESDLGVGGWGAGGLPFAIWGWGLRFGLGFAARGLQLAVWRLRFGAGGAVLGGLNFAVLPGVCGLDAAAWLAVCDLALRAV